MANRKPYTRRLRAAAALLLCVVLSAVMLFSRLVAYSAADSRQYIPLTESNGITTVLAARQDTSLSRKSGGFAPSRPLPLTDDPFLTDSRFRVTDENAVALAARQDSGLSRESGGFAPTRPLPLTGDPFLTDSRFRVTDENAAALAPRQDSGLSRESGDLDPNRPILLTDGTSSTDSRFRVTDENTVWTGDTEVEIFRVSYENGQEQITVKSSRGDKVIAPGTENSYTFALENTADEPLEYTMSMKAYFSSGDYLIPVEAKVTRDTDKNYLLGSAEDYADVLELNTVSDSGTLKKGYVMPYTLSWQWPFEGNDANDTMLGNLEEDLTLTIVIETTASYAPPTAEGGGVPKTGDTSHIGLWFAVMLGSFAGLIFMLLLMRQKGDSHEET